METDTVYERINYRFCNVSRSRSVCNVHDNAGHAREKFAGNFGKKVGSRVIFEEIFANLSVRRVSKNLRGSSRCYRKRCMCRM